MLDSIQNQPSKFRAKNAAELNSLRRTKSSLKFTNIKFELNSKLKPRLCHCGDVYIFFKWNYNSPIAGAVSVQILKILE